MPSKGKASCRRAGTDSATSCEALRLRDIVLKPTSRYQYHPPKFNRGPLHPIQSPASSDPLARDFEAGPFYFPRLKETLQHTVTPDLITLTYIHKPPGEQGEEPIGQRLRSWDGSSPYHKNRPLRGPRGGTTLRPVERPLGFKRYPEILAVTMSVYQPAGIKDPTYLLAARAALQAVTGAKPSIQRVKTGVSQWGITKGQPCGAKATVWGEQAYELLDKMIHLVFPRIKEWPGVSVETGDESGNVAWGFSPDQLALFPEIQINYDAYPPKVSFFLGVLEVGRLAEGMGANWRTDDSRVQSQRCDDRNVG